MGVMGKQVLVLGLVVLVFFVGASSASLTSSPTRIVNGYISNGVSALMKWLWSLKTTTKTVISSRPTPMMKFESGYTVETVFDGSKLGIEPHTVEELPGGELLILDAANSNLYKISAALSLYSRPKLIAGSAEGYSGYVDGKPREARMNHPKGLAVDDRGNIYVADTMNMAIRKISDTGVTTIAGGKWSRGGHQDGASEDAKFSNDFDVVYIGSSCSLLVIDRGNQAIREIQLHFDDCAYQYGSGFPLGIAVLVAAGFFGYMLALLQRRVGMIVFSQNDHAEITSSDMVNRYQKPKSVRPSLIPSEDDIEKHEESFLGSLGNLFANAGSSVADILGGILPGFRRKPLDYQYLTQQQHQKHTNTWPVQDSFVIRDEDEPPPPTVETRTPTPKKTYPFMSKDAENMHQWRQGQAFYNGWDGETHHLNQNQQHQQQHKQQYHHHQYQSTTPHHRNQNQQHQQQHKQQYHHRQYQSTTSHTYYEQSYEKTKEIVFGAVQEQDGKQKHEVKPVNYNDPIYSRYSLRARSNSMGYTNGIAS